LDLVLPISLGSAYLSLVVATFGAASTLAGRIVDAVPLLTQAVEQATAMETVVHQALCHFSLGEAQMLAGRLEEAHTLAERALAHARAHQERSYQAYTLRLLGDIAARRNPPDAVSAEAHYRMRQYLLDSAPLAAYLNGRQVAVDLISPWITHREAATSILVYGEITEYLISQGPVTFFPPSCPASSTATRGLSLFPHLKRCDSGLTIVSCASLDNTSIKGVKGDDHASRAVPESRHCVSSCLRHDHHGRPDTP
jgi:hypothetical protein